MKATYVQHCGNDLMVANSARVSFKKSSDWVVPEVEVRLGSEWNSWEKIKDYRKKHLSEKDVKLIHYLASHKHFSPFNHSFITIHVKAPIFVARQLQKHKFMPWNEVSRRYVDDKPEFYEPEWRARPEDGIKQGSGGPITIDKDTEQVYHYSISDALRAYERLLADGVAPEQARMVLPQSMYTEWYWSGTLGAWADMYKLRADAHAQKETQEIAVQCGKIIEPLFPVSWVALIGEN